MFREIDGTQIVNGILYLKGTEILNRIRWIPKLLTEFFERVPKQLTELEGNEIHTGIFERGMSHGTEVFNGIFRMIFKGFLKVSVFFVVGLLCSIMQANYCTLYCTVTGKRQRRREYPSLRHSIRPCWFYGCAVILSSEKTDGRKDLTSLQSKQQQKTLNQRRRQHFLPPLSSILLMSNRNGPAAGGDDDQSQQGFNKQYSTGVGVGASTATEAEAAAEEEARKRESKGGSKDKLEMSSSSSFFSSNLTAASTSTETSNNNSTTATYYNGTENYYDHDQDVSEVEEVPDDDKLYLLNDRQLVAIDVAFVISSVLSILGSSCLIYFLYQTKKRNMKKRPSSYNNNITTDRRTTTTPNACTTSFLTSTFYHGWNSSHRFLLGLSIFDIITSLRHGSSPFLQSDVGSVGCTIEGFLVAWTLIPPMYNTALSFFYCLTIRYSTSTSRESFAQHYEIYFHVLALVYPITISLLGVFAKAYNPSNFTPDCFISSYPTNLCGR